MNPYYSYQPWHGGYQQNQQAAYAAPPQPLAAPLASGAPGPPRPPVLQPPGVAYTAVAAPAARPRPAQAQPGAADGQAGPSSWPPALRRYVERAFALDVSGEQRLRLQVNLKEIIADAQQQGLVWTKDWDNSPLPDVLPQPRVQAALPPTALLEQRNGTARVPAFSLTPRAQKRMRSPDGRTTVNGHIKKAAKQAPPPKAAAHLRFPVGAVPEPDHREQAKAVRARRFGNGLAIGAVRDRGAAAVGHAPSWGELGSSVEDEAGDLHGSAVKGTCCELEKSYFRLTSKPDPSTVRPDPVLRQALQRLVLLLRQTQVTYFYAADQFKGMRQDCTVQHLRNALSASIYEAHARAALEHGDMAEFAQCQSQLLQHYSVGIGGCREEFVAYRLLSQAVHGRENHAALLSCLQGLSPQDAQHPAVSHALQVRQSLAAGDLAKVCMLYTATPNMGRALLDAVLPRLRFAALKVLVKAYLPSLPVHAIARRLGFSAADGGLSAPPAPPASSGDALELPGCTNSAFLGRHSPQERVTQGDEECEAWLQEQGASLVASPGSPGERAVDCKESGKELHFREEAVPVAAGPDLMITDFLKSVRGFN